MKRTPNSAVFIVMIACAVVFGIGLNFMAWSKVSARKASLAKLKADVDEQMKVPAHLKQSQQDLLDAQAGLKHLEQGVPEANYVPTMMRELEDLGNTCGVQVIAVKPVPAPPAAVNDKAKQAPKPYETLDLEVKGVGTYADALRFVSSLDTFPKIVEARSVSLEPEAKGDKKAALVANPKLTMSVLLRSYLFKTETRTAMDNKEVKNAG
jgi:Tfp pilus assembly protein PilO